MDTEDSGADVFMNPVEKSPALVDLNDPVASRRDALIKMGKFAAYTAPMLAVLLTANRVEAGGGPGRDACRYNAATNSCYCSPGIGCCHGKIPPKC